MVIGFLKHRRSIVAKKMLVGRVLKKDLNTILEIGTRVPDHGALKPWSIKAIGGNPNKDKVAGFIYIGKKITKPKERTRPNINEVVDYI